MARTIAGNRFSVRNFVSAGSFNGTDNYVSAGTYGTLGSSLNSGFSASFWVLSQQITAGTILGTRVSSTNNYLLIKLNSTNGSNNAGKIQVQFSDTSTTHVLNGSASVAQVNDGKWHHIVVTLMPSTNLITTYIDNVLQTQSYTTQTTPASFADFTNQIFFGALNNNGVVASPYFKGLLDEITLWNQILTASDVANLYYIGNTTSTPLSRHKFNENTGSTVGDSVGTNTGTWQGTLGSQWSTNVFMVGRTLRT